MDLELLSRMVGELLIEHDQVGLPGVGTFVAEMVPASFSDKGFTINPPYRRLTFSPSRLEDSLLIDFYADSNQIGREAASIYVKQYLAELKAVLEERKTVSLPGLGRLRATRENALFFVADEGLDIFPAGIGLRPVSLKSHPIQEDPVVIKVPLPLIAEAPETPAEAEPVIEAPAEEPAAEPEVPEEPAVEAPAEELEAPEEPVSEELAAEPEILEEPVPEEPEAIEPLAEPEEIPAGPQPQEEPATPEAAAPAKKKKKGMSWWGALLLFLLIMAVLALIVFIILARVAPDLIDSILYTPEELRILNY